MFSQGHLIWIGISAALIVGGVLVCLRRQPPLRRLFFVCLALGIVSEVIKVFSVSGIVPMVDPVIAEQNSEAVLQWIPTGEYTPYLPMEHLPLELCSLYLLFMLLVEMAVDRLPDHSCGTGCRAGDPPVFASSAEKEGPGPCARLRYLKTRSVQEPIALVCAE